jgi:aspartate carbamoyltransferase regulatory subunit
MLLESQHKNFKRLMKIKERILKLEYYESIAHTKPFKTIIISGYSNLVT